MASWPETKMANGRGHCLMLLSLQGPFGLLMALGVALSLEVSCKCLAFQVTGFGSH